MSIGDNTENNILKLIFNATAWADYAENDTSSPHTAVAYALATGDPGDTGTMSTSEVAYTNYARASKLRATGAGGHTVTNNSVSPADAITFAAGTGGSGTVTHFSAGKTGGGAVDILFSGTVTPNIVTGNGITPSLTTATAITLD